MKLAIVFLHMLPDGTEVEVSAEADVVIHDPSLVYSADRDLTPDEVADLASIAVDKLCDDLDPPHDGSVH